MKVYALVRDYDDYDSILALFSTRFGAEKAIESGRYDIGGGFDIDEWEVDEPCPQFDKIDEGYKLWRVDFLANGNVTSTSEGFTSEAYHACLYGTIHKWRGKALIQTYPESLLQVSVWHIFAQGKDQAIEKAKVYRRFMLGNLNEADNVYKWGWEFERGVQVCEK